MRSETLGGRHVRGQIRRSVPSADVSQICISNSNFSPILQTLIQLFDRYPFGYHRNTFNSTYSKWVIISTSPTPKLAPFSAFSLQDFHFPLYCVRQSSSTPLPTSFPSVHLDTTSWSDSHEILETIPPPLSSPMAAGLAQATELAPDRHCVSGLA